MVNEFKHFVLNFIVSGSAAVFSKTLIAPVERIKFLMQNQDSALQVLTGERKRYENVSDAVRRIPREQGFFSFWRGNCTNLIRYFPTQALNFAFYDFYKSKLYCFVDKEYYKSIFLCKLVSGGLAGGCSSFIVYPLDFCQTRVMVDVGASKCSSLKRPRSSGALGKACKKRDTYVIREFTGLISCLSKVWKRDGLCGLYRGVHLSVAGIAVYRAHYFALFDMEKYMYNKYSNTEPNTKPPFLAGFLMAQVATVVSGLIAYPLDTMSRRMMLDSGRPDNLRVSRTTSMTFKAIFNKYGMCGFYKGALVNIVRCTAGALVLVLYDEFLHYTQWKDRIK